MLKRVLDAIFGNPWDVAHRMNDDIRRREEAHRRGFMDALRIAKERPDMIDRYIEAGPPPQAEYMMFYYVP
jgi:hypothetical protein